MPIHTAVATLHTNYGDIVVNLFGDHAPQTVQNFVGLADGRVEWTDPATGAASAEPLYKDVVFHRIISGFMIQGGDPLGQGTGGPGYNFNDEINGELDLHRAVQARDGERRPAPQRITGQAEGTNGSQFFITVPVRAAAARVAAGQAHDLRRGGRRRVARPSSTRSPRCPPRPATVRSSPSSSSRSTSSRSSELARP